MKIVMFVEVQEGLLEIYCNNVVTNLIFEATRGITSSHSLDSLLFFTCYHSRQPNECGYLILNEKIQRDCEWRATRQRKVIERFCF